MTLQSVVHDKSLRKLLTENFYRKRSSEGTCPEDVEYRSKEENARNSSVDDASSGTVVQLSIHHHSNQPLHGVMLL